MNMVNAGIKIVKASTAMLSDCSAGAIVGDIISMKNWGHCDICIRTGATFDSDAEVTVQKGSSVSSAATALAFPRYLQQGKIVRYTGASGVFTVGETVTGGTSSTTGVVYKDFGSYLVLYDCLVSTPAFTAAETLTGGTSSVTATAAATVSGGTYADDECDIMVPRTATSNTFDLLATTEVEMLYIIPIDAEMLGDGYDCIEANVANSGGGSNAYLDMFYILSEPRYMNEFGGPSAIIN